ncbi:MAG: hypothetical protein KAI57_04010 [Candidatus Pacebacteria bacterium]|nr:hypothetical protein [Candidatus Paceibacterota bacterium]
MVEINSEKINLQEIEDLEKKLAEKKAGLAEKMPLPEKKEIEITEKNFLEKYKSQISTQTQQVIVDDEEKKEKHIKKATEELKSLDTPGKVARLVVIAFEKGIGHSINIARNLNDAYLLDALHDKLIGELHDELVEKGKLKDL